MQRLQILNKSTTSIHLEVGFTNSNLDLHLPSAQQYPAYNFEAVDALVTKARWMDKLGWLTYLQELGNVSTDLLKGLVAISFEELCTKGDENQH